MTWDWPKADFRYLFCTGSERLHTIGKSKNDTVCALPSARTASRPQICMDGYGTRGKVYIQRYVTKTRPNIARCRGYNPSDEMKHITISSFFPVWHYTDISVSRHVLPLIDQWEDCYSDQLPSSSSHLPTPKQYISRSCSWSGTAIPLILVLPVVIIYKWGLNSSSNWNESSTC